MEIDFEFELESDKTMLGLHSINESWATFQNEEQIWPVKEKRPVVLPHSNDGHMTIFPYRDLRLYGTRPILEPYSAVSYIVSLATSRSRDLENHAPKTDSNSSSRYSEKHYTSSSSSSSTFKHSKSRKRHADRSSVSHASTERHDNETLKSVWNNGSSSGSLYLADVENLRPPPISICLPPVNANNTTPNISPLFSPKKRVSSTSKRHVTSSSSSYSSSSRSNNNSSSARTSGHSSARTSGHSSSRSSGSSRSKSHSTSHSTHSNSHDSHSILSSNSHSSHSSAAKKRTMLEDILPQFIAETLLPCDKPPERVPSELPGAATCRARTELFALKVSTPDILPDTIPTVADSPETAGSPTKPTDEPALPEEQPFLSPPPPLNADNLSTTSTITLLEIQPHDFSIEKLRMTYPNLRSLFPPKDSNTKLYPKYDRLPSKDKISDVCCDTSQPKQKIVKFKVIPYIQKTSETVNTPESLKHSSSNVYLMEVAAPKTSSTVVCDGKEVKTTDTFYIAPESGIYESQADARHHSPKGVHSTMNFLIDEKPVSLKRNRGKNEDGNAIYTKKGVFNGFSQTDTATSDYAKKCEPSYEAGIGAYETWTDRRSLNDVDKANWDFEDVTPLNSHKTNEVYAKKSAFNGIAKAETGTSSFGTKCDSTYEEGSMVYDPWAELQGLNDAEKTDWDFEDVTPLNSHEGFGLDLIQEYGFGDEDIDTEINFNVFDSLFSGMYDINSFSASDSKVKKRECSKVPQVNSRFRQLAPRPPPKAAKVGNPITPSILQDYLINNTVKNYLQDIGSTTWFSHRKQNVLSVGGEVSNGLGQLGVSQSI